MSIFLKPPPPTLAFARCVFAAALRRGITPLASRVVGTLVDRYGGRWLMVIGTAIVAIGYFILTHVENFAQFAAVRLTLVTLGDSMMGYMVVNVIIAQWFVRQRGRALAFSSMGVGFAKVCMPVLAAWLILSLGWRQTWLVFGFITLLLLVVPALLVIRRSPESMGLLPDGAARGLSPHIRREKGFT